MTYVQAHRGASAYTPQNTLESFALAVKQKADGVELDVHLSADGRLIVCHNDSVEDTSNGIGKIKDMTADELKRLDFSKPHPEYSPCEVPFLDEVYELLKDTGLVINVEIKAPEAAVKCIGLAKKYGIQSRIMYSSFNHECMKKMKEYDGSLKTGLLYGEKPDELENRIKYYLADAVHPHYGAIDGQTFEICKRLGIIIRTWTVNDEDIMEKCFAAGLDTIITNYPDTALAVRDKITEKA